MKKKNRWAFFLVVACVLLPMMALCSCEKTKEKFTTYSFDYFDTVTTIIGYESDKEEFDKVSGYILSELGDYHKLFTVYNRYEGMENLCTVNDIVDGAHRTVKVDERIIDMLIYARQMYEKTNGKLNVAMGSVLSIWHGYRQEGEKNPAKAELPPMDKLLAAADHTDISNMVIDTENCTVTLTDPQMTLDVGAIAKGYAVEMVARSLKEKGISGYVINVGGNVRTVGAKPDLEAWSVGIENPDEDGSDYIAYLNLTDMSLVTSGSYQRYYFVDGEKYHHIIDPETLMPAQRYTSVSIVCESSALGDALSTALFCMTLEEGKALVESLDGVEALWLTNDGNIHRSSGFSKYEN
ncbi:MAG: FAD:protein FMN transferase [Ruminococcaceae bacterium]|nr:FAD:protein FMN transferase [Oscillospiraceae bacterium]